MASSRALLAAGAIGIAAVLSAAAPASPKAVEAAVQASLSIKKLPSDLTPSLQQISTASGYWKALSTSYITPACDAALKPALQTNPKACFYGDLKAKKTVILYGDSDAANWAPGLDIAFRTLRIRLALIAMPGCASGFMHYTQGQTGYPQACDTWHSHLGPLAKSLHPFAVMLVSEGVLRPPAWFPAIAKAFQVMTGGRSAVKRILVGTSPDFNTSVPSCLAGNPTAVQSCTLNYSDPTSMYALVLARDQQLARSSKATLMPVVQWLCFKQQCSPIVKSYLVYPDNDHLSIAYSEYLTGVLGAATKKHGL
jgi:hypothetical protein